MVAKMIEMCVCVCVCVFVRPWDCILGFGGDLWTSLEGD